jgi:hypothetical protein
MGPFKSIDEAIKASCPVIVRQSNATIPVAPNHQDFRTYWHVSSEYCAWIYSGNGTDVELSWLAFDPFQPNPKKRTCSLPEAVADSRYAQEKIAHLVIIHSHPYPRHLDVDDLQILSRMARVHGSTFSIADLVVPISIVAFFGRARNGATECAGYYHYTPTQNAHILQHTVDPEGRWTVHVAGRVVWPADGSLPSVEATTP